ncbi:hypothetical protein [Mycobacterium lacus]|uniref:Uncharacterized protein n=1 Tax=Mycobacterium lacus TaxID=169765 RepID=A0A1X1Y7Q8_9MYCO|nr:hypothetical protein [Mycobacterium lacus]MCV7125387.1 hypothetical protein [Mycobacterium lacus]ORW07147.1 hypothetical protein AWC15_20580 [Mycobacterium lacus]BBX97803.1 hypothetical protein MLAC_30970 [Mycobacterium lacus]
MLTRLIKALFDDLKHTLFEYRWLEALRDALQHSDIGVFESSFNVSVSADPDVKIDVDRAFMPEPSLAGLVETAGFENI